MEPLNNIPVNSTSGPVIETVNFKAAFEAMPGIGVLVGVDSPRFTVLAVTDELLQSQPPGVRKDHLTGKSFFEAFSFNPDTSGFAGESDILTSFKQVITSKEAHHLPVYRYDLANGDGTFREQHRAACNKPVLDDEGNVIHIIHFFEDVTDKIKPQQREEIRSIKQMHNLFMQAPVAIQIFKGPELIIKLANELALRQWGKDKDVIGKPLIEVLPQLLNNGFASVIKEVIQKGKSYKSYESPVILQKNGKEAVTYFNYVLQPYFGLGKTEAAGALVLATDVTDQVTARKKTEESEHRYRTLIEESTVAAALYTGREMRVQYANDIMIGYWGKDSSAIGKPLRQVLPELEGQPFFDLLDTVYVTGKPYRGTEEKADLFVNGKLQAFYFNFTYKALRDKEGQIYGIHQMAQDVTGQVLAKRALEENERILRNLILQAPVAIAILRNENYVVEIANEKALEVWGRKEKEVINKPVLDAMPELLSQGIKSLLDNVYATGNSFSATELPVKLKRKENSGIAYLNFVFEPLYNADGTVNGIMAAGVEVTEQVVARKKIEESEHQVRILVESAPFPIGVYTGKEMRIELANQAMVNTLGKGNDVIGKLYPEVLPELNNQEIFQNLGSVFTTGIPFHAKNQRVELVVDKKLQPYYFNYSFTPLHDSSGNVYGVMNTAADVTDLNLAKQRVEESERNFRNLVMHAPVGICIAGGNPLQTEVVNDSFLEITGKTRKAFEEAAYLEVVPETAPFYAQIMEKVLKTGIAYRGQEHKGIFTRNGREETVYVNFVYDPIKEEDGSVSKVMIVVIEVTEQVIARRKIEEVVAQRTKELAEANKALQQTNRELEQFAYIASHDLQEPLRKVSTFAEMLKVSLGKVDERSDTYLNKITASSARMLQLIRDVLNFSQLAKDREAFVPVDLNALMQSITNDFELLIEQKNVRINLSDLPAIEAITLQMQQLFGNLLSNALKFTRNNVPPVITISAQRLLKEEKSRHEGLLAEEDYFLIRVEDNGIGFNQEYAAQIFGIFQRLHRKADYAGTGIGLALCKKIVQNHHGDIYATSTKDAGAVFSVILPAKQGIKDSRVGVQKQ